MGTRQEDAYGSRPRNLRLEGTGGVLAVCKVLKGRQAGGRASGE